MPERQLILAARQRAIRIRAVAQHFAQRIVEPLPMPHTFDELQAQVRELSLTSAVREYLRAKRAESEN